MRLHRHTPMRRVRSISASETKWRPAAPTAAGTANWLQRGRLYSAAGKTASAATPYSNTASLSQSRVIRADGGFYRWATHAVLRSGAARGYTRAFATDWLPTAAKEPNIPGCPHRNHPKHGSAGGAVFSTFSMAPTTTNDPTDVSPAMRQYFATKEAHPDCLMFCRIGQISTSSFTTTQ